MEETAAKGEELFRFGFPKETLVKWPQIGRHADVKWSGRPLRRNSCGYHRAATATQEFRRGQADREQTEALSHTGSFGWNLSSQELVLLGRDFFEFLRTIGASTDTPSPSSAYIQKI
jgi:hypothetical protein